MDVYGHLWIFMDMYGRRLMFMDIDGYLWTCKGGDGNDPSNNTMCPNCSEFIKMPGMDLN